MKLSRENFTVKDIVGIKASRIVSPGDPCGTSTVIVCMKDPNRC
jgi:hypothetical protein